MITLMLRYLRYALPLFFDLPPFSFAAAYMPEAAFFDDVR